MMADQEFKRTLGNIELHKLRYGNYPSSLKALKFLSVWDSTGFAQIEYHKLDSGYELNVKGQIFSEITKPTKVALKLHYPAEFWKGLGCVKSNAM